MTNAILENAGHDRPVPATAAGMLEVWDDCGVLGWEAIVDGEMKIIKHYMRDNRLPGSFLRLVFHMGVSAYLSAHDQMPEVLPMPFRKIANSKR